MMHKLDTIMNYVCSISSLLYTATQVYYIVSQHFYLPFFYYLSIICIFAPTFLFAIIFPAIILATSRSATKLSIMKVALFIAANFIGIHYFLIALANCYSLLTLEQLTFYNSVLRTSSLLNSVFNAAPFLILQFFNNQNTNNWTWLTIWIACVSASILFITCLKLVTEPERSANFTKVDNHDDKIDPNVKITENHYRENIYSSSEIKVEEL